MLKKVTEEMDALIVQEDKNPKINLFAPNHRSYYLNWKNSVCSKCEICRFAHKKIDNQVVLRIKCDGFNVFLSEYENFAFEKQDGELLKTTIDSCFTCGGDK